MKGLPSDVYDSDYEQGLAQADHFSLQIDPIDTVQRHVSAQVVRERSRTENWIAKTLVMALVLSFPVMAIIVAIKSDDASSVMAVFERWITVIGPIVGAAVGFGALSRSHRRDG